MFSNYAKKADNDLLKARVDQLLAAVKELKKQLDGLDSRFKQMKQGKGGADPGALADLQSLYDSLREEFEKFKDYTNRNLQDLNITMPTKADKQDLVDLEQRMSDKLNEVLRQLLELIPNKDELNKKFEAINRKLRQIMEMLANRPAGDHEDDGMLTKKHLGPMACASCEKDLVNI